MKTCPKCHTKYTDDTLKFCLQDGSSLESINDEQTVAFDQDLFANEETFAENFSDKTQNYQGKTEAFTHRETKDNNQKSVSQLKTENPSQVTIERPKEINISETPSFKTEEKPTKKGRLGFLMGFLIGLVLIGLVGIGILGIIYLPSMIGKNANTNANSNEATPTPKKEIIISDTNDVKISSSSTRKSIKGNAYYPKLAFDGNSRTAWSEGASGPGRGQWIAFDFNKEVNLKEIIIEPGYFKTEELWRKNNRLSAVTLKFSDGSTRGFKFNDEMKEQKIDLNSVKTESVMFTIKDIYAGQADSKDTLISEVKFVVQEE